MLVPRKLRVMSHRYGNATLSQPVTAKEDAHQKLTSGKAQLLTPVFPIGHCLPWLVPSQSGLAEICFSLTSGLPTAELTQLTLFRMRSFLTDHPIHSVGQTQGWGRTSWESSGLPFWTYQKFCVSNKLLQWWLSDWMRYDQTKLESKNWLHAAEKVKKKKSLWQSVSQRGPWLWIAVHMAVRKGRKSY